MCWLFVSYCLHNEVLQSRKKKILKLVSDDSFYIGGKKKKKDFFFDITVVYMKKIICWDTYFSMQVL